MANFTLPPDPNEQTLAQRQALAQALMQRGLQPMQTQMAGRRAVPVSHTQGLSQLAQVLGGSMMNKSVNEDRSKLAHADEQALMNSLSGETINPQDLLKSGSRTGRQMGLYMLGQQLAAPKESWNLTDLGVEGKPDMRQKAYVKQGQDPKFVGAPYRAMQDSTSKTVATQFAAKLDESRDLARSAGEAWNVADRLDAALPGAVVGPGASMIATVQNALGVGSPEKTKTVMRQLAELTLASRGLLKGQGTVTDKEQELLERAKSGDIDKMNRDEIQSMIGVVRRATKAAYDNHADLMKRSALSPELQPYLRMWEIDTPPAISNYGKPAPKTNATAPAAKPADDDSLLKKYGVTQ